MPMNFREIPRRFPEEVEKPDQVLLRQAIAELKKRPTPESVTNYWRAKFQIDGARARLNILVPDCNWTEEEIQRPMIDIHGNELHGTMVPVVSGITLPNLGRMCPKMSGLLFIGEPPPISFRDDTPIKDIHNTRGWVKVYASVDAPNLNTGTRDAKKFADDHGYLPG